MCSILIPGGQLLLRGGNVPGVLPQASSQSQVAWPAYVFLFLWSDSVVFCCVPGYFRWLDRWLFQGGWNWLSSLLDLLLCVHPSTRWGLCCYILVFTDLQGLVWASLCSFACMVSPSPGTITCQVVNQIWQLVKKYSQNGWPTVSFFLPFPKM